MNRTNAGGMRRTFEIPILIMIAGLVFVLMKFTNRKIDELMMNDSQMIYGAIEHDSELHQNLTDSIQEFRPGVYKMVELYDSNFQLIIRIKFSSDYQEAYDYDMNDYPKLIDILSTHQMGHTTIETDDSEQYIYFNWSETTSGEQVLSLIYANKKVVQNFWVFNLLCYLIIVLVGMLIVRLITSSRNERIKYYENMSTNIML